MTKLHREIIGRGAMVVMGIALLFGGVKCFTTAARIRAGLRDQYATSSRSSVRASANGTALPILVGVVLTLLGAPLTVAAIVPVSVFARLMGRQRNVTLWENPGPSRHLRDIP